MGRYTAISARPKNGASSLMSQLTFGTLSFTGPETSVSSSTVSAFASSGSKKCFFCPKTFTNDSTRRQHIVDSSECSAAQHAILERAAASQAAIRRGPDSSEGAPSEQPARSNTPDRSTPANKRRRVTVEDVPDQDAPNSAAKAPNPAGPSSSSHEELPTNGEPARPTRTGPPEGRERVARKKLRRCGGLYVEEFPDPLAGSPISNERVSPPDLKAYMQSVGKMADPETFEVAELLMTSGLTDAAKDRHLKSTMVSSYVE
ncbi:hypothetical protein FRC12_002889 [Ceratobasidium sp. 428]|nr:hypothetical protein FRC12_002889 [Ceratobasidium sp. 428]